jgi:hypothetical protein
MIALNHPAPHVPPQGLSFLSRKELATTSSPILPLMDCKQTTASQRDVQFLDLILVNCGRLSATPFKHAGCAFKQRALALVDHRRLSGM